MTLVENVAALAAPVQKILRALSLQAAIDSAEKHGTLFVASAGNDGVDTDTTAHYPSSMNSSIVLAVGASDSSDNLWARSNYGKTTVQVWARA